jgi:hypothetical protein
LQADRKGQLKASAPYVPIRIDISPSCNDFLSEVVICYSFIGEKWTGSNVLAHPYLIVVVDVRVISLT